MENQNSKKPISLFEYSILKQELKKRGLEDYLKNSEIKAKKVVVSSNSKKIPLLINAIESLIISQMDFSWLKIKFCMKVLLRNMHISFCKIIPAY